MKRDIEHDNLLAISSLQIAEARQQAALNQKSVIEALEELLDTSPDRFMRLVADYLHYPLFGMGELEQQQVDFQAISYGECLAKNCLLLTVNDQYTLVIANPFDQNLLSWCETRIARIDQIVIAHQSDIAAYLGRKEEGMRAVDTALENQASQEVSDETIIDLTIQKIHEDNSPVVRLVHSTLYDALKSGVSDIHLESHNNSLQIKYRIDGALIHIGTSDGREVAEQVITRIKVMSELDISERRIPQDGRFRIRALGRQIDFRVSIMPSIHGEDAVLRILDKKLANETTSLNLSYAGFDDATLTQFRRLIQEPYGLVLVTGPTGSGKTTTLYAALSEINRGDDKIITIEDPVEYQLNGILQIPVNEKKGLTFARGLRSILRHDPDRIMVGEIRDPETAQIAVQSALTGHLVFSTVHANNVFDVIGRFTHMDVDPYSFVSALNGVLAQRLIRVSCPHCVKEIKPDYDELRLAGIMDSAIQTGLFKAAQGCGQCRGTGYKGRKAIGELLILNDEIRELIIARESIRKIKEAAKRNGTRLLRESAVNLLLNGETTLQEVNRVTLAS